VRIWPRLIHIMPQEYYEKIEQSNNGLAFLINCSILTLFLGVLSLLAAGYQWLVRHYALSGKTELLYFIPVDAKLTEIYHQRILIYLGFFVIMSLASRLFYRASFPIAIQYGNMIRSAFDLFRFDLLRQLNLALPKDSGMEHDTWKKVSEFIAVGEYWGPFDFEYQIAADETRKGCSS
jgi:uncharacterized membrane protein